jgi:aryl-alcohol dehydrogenase-like predicted oxidoreductase
MRYRRLGRTGLSVSEISLGTVEIGMAYGIGPTDDRRPCSEEMCERLLHHALDLGINHIDTARAYGNSEELIGRALASRRSEFILTTKVLVPEDAGRVDVTLRGLMFASVETSLKLLKTSCIDILMLHSASIETLKRSAVTDALLNLRDQNYCRFLGASVYGSDAALAAIKSGAFDCLQVAYSMLDRRPETVVFPAACRDDIGIVARSVLLKGALTHRHKYLPSCLLPLAAAASRLEMVSPSLPHLAYRYVLNQVPPHTALIGTTRISELDDIVGHAADTTMDPCLIKAIRAETVLDEKLLNPATWPAC